jgi:hypothetical protein
MHFCRQVDVLSPPNPSLFYPMPFSLHRFKIIKLLAKAMASEKYNKIEDETREEEAQQESLEASLRQLLEDARCKSEAYRKILNSLNINTNKNKD